MTTLLFSLTCMEGEGQAGFTPAAPLDGDHREDGSLAALEVCEGAARAVGCAGRCVITQNCGHILVRFWCRLPGDMAQVTDTLHGHMNVGGRAGACEGEGEV